MISSPDVDSPFEPEQNVESNPEPKLESNVETGTATEAAGSAGEEAKPLSPMLKEFCEKLGTFATPEEKITYGLQFMRGSISQEGSPRFREFWEARKFVLPFFKENLNPAIRSTLWGEYVELTVEARRLKEILEEQSAFAMEQIDLAVKALEEEAANFSALLGQAGEVAFPEGSEILRKKGDVYSQIQKELNLLNTLASRLNALRKEVIKTDMRIRFKTKFFKRLSDLGDRIFPKRKELIEAISSEFEKDVDRFVSGHFKAEGVVGAPYYALREEIKSLQGLAKLLTLSSQVFTRTRLKLSECWDQVKVLEKEHKKEAFERKQASTEQRAPIQTKIDALKEKAASMNLKDLDQEIYQIQTEMRSVSLHRDDVRSMKDELTQLRMPLIRAQEQKAKELEEIEKEKLRQKKEKVALFKEKMAKAAKEAERMDLEALQAVYQELQEEAAQFEFSKMEKQQIDRSLRQLKDQIADKKEHSLLNLSEDEKKNLENLRAVLQQKKERRQEIKEQLEMHRKVLGSSGLDFEKAMHYRELVDQDRERLEKANAGIEELEQKIAALEG